jgi:tetratricopeptide (TPR) repeat protein
MEGETMKKFTLFILGLLMSLSLFAMPQTEIIGSYYKTPEQKAMECYGRGLKAKKKADAETDAAKQAKLYLKAKEELSKSVGYHPNFDGYLALGQVYLAMGDKRAGLTSCSQALGLKPNNEQAKSCIQAAQETQEASASGQDGNSGGD